MSDGSVKLKKLLSKQTIEKLDTALTKGNLDGLKKHMEKLFTFKNIFNMHDDHLIELAECLVDLAQAEDRMECAKATEQYALGRMARYQNRKRKLEEEYQWKKATKSKDEVEMMDMEYRVWVYEAGFEYSKFHMYSMLCNITQEIRKEGKR